MFTHKNYTAILGIPLNDKLKNILYRKFYTNKKWDC